MKLILPILLLLLTTTPSLSLPSPHGPAAYVVGMTTSHGNTAILFQRASSPYASDRVFAMASARILDDSRFFRVIRNDSQPDDPGFVAQWGIPGAPALTAAWLNDLLPNEDPIPNTARRSNSRGTVALGAEYNADKTATCCRSIEMYVNYADNSRLDPLGFTPFGTVLALPQHIDRIDSPEATQWASDLVTRALEQGDAFRPDPQEIERGMQPLDELYAGYGEDISWQAMYDDGNAYLDVDRPLLSKLNTFFIMADSLPPPPPAPSPHTYMAPQERIASILTLTAFSLAALAAISWAAVSYIRARNSYDLPRSLDGVPLV